MDASGYGCKQTRRKGYELVTKIGGSGASKKMGRKYGGRVTLLDDSMSLRLRAIGLGTGRHSLESRGESAPIAALFEMWPDHMAHDLQERRRRNGALIQLFNSR